MRVRDLLVRLQNLDQDATVEFHDVTHNRDCPVNSLEELPQRDKVSTSSQRVVLSNRLGR